MRKLPTWSKPWRGLRLRVFARDGYRCRACGKAGILECDHVQPIQAGGGDGMENLQTLCRGCHIAKTARERRPAQPRTPEQRRYRQLVEELI